MSKKNWKDTKIFTELSTRTGEYSDSIKNLLNRPEVMAAIELILDSGGTTPKDFTLHDAAHSFRVAERMWDLIPDDTRVRLSEYELGLLLLSAYLHDIGMSPDFEKVEKHHQFLTSNIKDQLTENEIDDFQRWIDDDNKATSIDIRKERVEDSDLLVYILAYYVRFKHNDWSGDWINANLAKFTLTDYNGWVADLVKICKSHHYGIEELVKDVFDPKPINTGVNVHLRYISMCLRVSDVMENDPERTPSVILTHRNISSSSLKFWLKDKQFNLTRNGNNFNIYARPEKAYIHKAIEDTATWIEDELRLCDELTKMKPLTFSPFNDISYYVWELSTFLYKDISPKEDTYVYIQGGFRPNTAKILELLGGNQLYGNLIWAYRELLQNSFDAIKERIAYTIINENRNAKEYQAKLGEIYSIDLNLDKRNDGIWLVCKDQGVGMTKKILEKFFLESGSSKRHEIIELERKAKLHGFKFSRTGQFGIGVLSYFMIAEKVLVKTKRELNTGYSDAESQAWYFEINGSHDFGELKKLNTSIIGTHIEFKLRPEIVNNIQNWDNKFRKFINESIAFAPCRISYTSFLSDFSKVVNFGWTNDIQDIKAKIASQFSENLQELTRRAQRDILSKKEEQSLENNLKLLNEAINEMPSMVDFLYEEGDIMGIGKYRIIVPYFKLMSGNCFYYLKEHVTSKQHQVMNIFDGYFWIPQFRNVQFSLKGMNINVVGNVGYENQNFHFRHQKNAYVEIDIENSKEENLSVSRHTLIYEDHLKEIRDLIEIKVGSLLNANSKLFENIYYSLNREIFEFVGNEEYWFFKNAKNDDIIWKKADVPLVDNINISNADIKYLKKEINSSISVTDYTRDGRLEWFNKLNGQYIIAFNKRTNRKPILGDHEIILNNKLVRNDIKGIKFIEMPIHWKNVLYITSSYGLHTFDEVYFNASIKSNLKQDLIKKFDSVEFNIGVKDLNSRELCLAFIISCARNYRDSTYDALCEKRPAVMNHVFKKLKFSQLIIVQRFQLYILTPEKWLAEYGTGVESLLTENLTDQFFYSRKQSSK